LDRVEAERRRIGREIAEQLAAETEAGLHQPSQRDILLYRLGRQHGTEDTVRLIRDVLTGKLDPEEDGVAC